MHYQITEEEFYRLEGVMLQLGFIYDLCGHSRNDDFQQMDIRGLLAFVAAQEGTIRQTINAATERYEQQRAGERLDAVDILNLVDMLAGKHSRLAPDAASRIMLHLVAEAKDNSLYGRAVESFSEYLVPAPTPAQDWPTAIEGADPEIRASKGKSAAVSRTAKPKATPRKRQKLVEGAAS